MIKRVKQHKSCVRIQYTKEAGSSSVRAVTLPMLRASSLLITSGATLAEQKVHWMRSFEDIWKRVGAGAEALEPIVLDAEWQLQMQVQVNLDKLFETLDFPAGDYVIRRSTPADRLLVQPIPNRPLKNQHLRMLVLQLLYVQQEFSEVRFDIIEAADTEALGDKLSRDTGSSAAYLETKPDVLQPIEPPTAPEPAAPTVPAPTVPAPTVPAPQQPPEAEPTTPTSDPDTNLPDSTNTDPKAWLGKRRKSADYAANVLRSLGYTWGFNGYLGKMPKQLIYNQPYDALGFALNSDDEVEFES